MKIDPNEMIKIDIKKEAELFQEFLTKNEFTILNGTMACFGVPIQILLENGVDKELIVQLFLNVLKNCLKLAETPNE